MEDRGECIQGWEMEDGSPEKRGGCLPPSPVRSRTCSSLGVRRYYCRVKRKIVMVGRRTSSERRSSQVWEEETEGEADGGEMKENLASRGLLSPGITVGLMSPN